MAQPQYGMFGPLPWEVQQMQNQQFEQAAIQRAQLAPGEHNAVMSALGGRALGQGIGSVFGIEDPAVARSKQLQSIAKEVKDSGIDPSNFEAYYGKLGESLAKAGLMREAASVADAVQSYRDKQAELDTKKFNAETARMKMQAYKDGILKTDVAIQIFEKAEKYQPASLKAYADSVKADPAGIGDMSLLRPADKPPEGYDEQGITDKGLYVYDNKTANPVVRDPTTNKLVPYNPQVHGMAKSTKASSTKVDVTLPSNQVTVEAPAPADAMSDVDAQLLGQAQKKAMEDFNKAKTVMRDVQKAKDGMSRLVANNKLITGFGSGTRLEIARLLNTIGAKGFSDSLNDSDFFDKFGKEQVLPLMEKLGGSDSNEELRTLLAATPNRQWTPEVIKWALNEIQDKANEIKHIDDQYKKFRSEGRTDVSSFDFTTGWYPEKPTTYKKDQPKREVKIKDATPAQAAAAMTPNQPVPIPQQPPVGNPAFESQVTRYMQNKGVTREQAVQALMAIVQRKGK